MALVPILVIVFYLPWPWSGQASAVVFILAALTDWADGWIARRLGQTSTFGAFLDPVADKLMVSTALVLLVQSHAVWYVTIPAAIIVGREIAVSGLREWMSEIGRRADLNVHGIAKLKTIVQMTAISLILWAKPLWFIPVHALGLILLGVAAVLTLWSMFIYLRAAWPHMREHGEGGADGDG